jgi:hypothetical protein
MRRRLRLLLLAFVSAWSAAAQVPPVWVPPAGWERLGDKPTNSGTYSGYALDAAGGLWYTGLVFTGTSTYDFHRLDLTAPLPGQWQQVAKGPVSFALNSTPLFFSHPDTVLVGGQGTKRTVTGPGGFAEVISSNPRALYRRVSSRGFGERVFAHNSSSGGGIDIRASDNRGRTWRALDWPGINQPNFAVLAVASYPTVAGVWGDSSTLPLGRLVFGTTFGAVLSDDNGETAAQGGLFGQAFTIHQISVLARPEGGLRIVAMGSVNGGGCGCSRVWTSDDHGASFVQRALLNDPLSPNSNTAVALLPQVRRPDGSLWVAGPSQATPSWQTSDAVLVLSTGILYRTSDGGVTWSQAPPPYDRIPFEAPFNDVKSALMDSGGRLYPNVFEFAHGGGDARVWAIRSSSGFPVASEAVPPSSSSSSGLSVRVTPNPVSGAVVLTLASERAEHVRVEVVDASGRIVHETAEVWATPSGAELRLPSERWAAGVYVARASGGRHTEHVTARFTVVR